MAEVKERPIIFSGPMVRAILAGRKTQTRRVLKVQPIDIIPMSVPNKWVSMTDIGPTQGEVFNCRYGNPGDLLWVREAYNPGLKPEKSRADGYWGCVYRADDFSAKYSGGWTPSIHMPRRHSRITLEIVRVRVERLQSITGDDARAEGIKQHGLSEDWEVIASFSELWNSINAKRGYSWESNPFVWVLSFKVITPANNAMQATRLRVATASA